MCVFVQRYSEGLYNLVSNTEWLVGTTTATTKIKCWLNVSLNQYSGDPLCQHENLRGQTGCLLPL